MAAEQGDSDGQLFLAAFYRDGHGVPQDYVQAYMWFNLAASHNSDIDYVRDKLAERMTQEQIAEGQKLSREWKPKNQAKRYSLETLK